MEKQEKKQKKILTENRLTTVNKRETSFEGLVSQFENGEDGVYNLIHESKVAIFQPKISITKKDLEEIPLLRQLRESITDWEKKLRTTQGKEAYVIKKALIEMRRDQYIIKNAYRKPFIPNKIIPSKNFISLNDNSLIDLTNPKVCSAILCNYTKLKQDSWGEFEKDLWYLLYDFDELCGVALEDYPLYLRLIEHKVDGLQNAEIQQLLFEEFNIKHSLEYISSLWRKKIPNLIAAAAEDQYLYYYYLNEEYGKYKRCSRCGKVKLAHNKYFSKNKTSKDGFYSICKDCRNSKKK